MKTIRPDWEALYAQAGSGNPFLQWDWAWHWWQCYGTGCVPRRHFLQMILLWDQDNKLRALVPFVRTTWGVGWLGYSALRLLGFDEHTMDLRTSLLCPGWEIPAAQAVIKALTEQSRFYDWCEWEGIPSVGPLRDHLEAHFPRNGGAWKDTLSEYLLPLPETWEVFRASLKRNVKENIRHCYNSLQREGHVWQFEAVGGKEDLPEALEELYDLHEARSRMPSRIFHPNHYADPKSRRFLQEVSTALAETGRLQIYRIRLQEKVIATRLVFRQDTHLYLSSSGYDPAWRRYSVMTLLTTECIKRAIAEKLSYVSLSTGADLGKTRWGPTEKITLRAELRSPRLRSLIAYYVHQQVLRLKPRRSVFPLALNKGIRL